MWQYKQDNVMLPDMWPGKQVNAAGSGQSFPPQRVPGEHMENRLGPSFGNFDVDFLGGPSRKRKLTPTDQQCMAPQSSFQISAPRQANLQSSSFVPGPQVGQSTPDLCANQTSSYQPTNFMGQFQKDQFSYLNCEPGYRQASEGKSQGSKTLNIGNASACISQTFDQKGLFGSHNQQSGRPAVLSNWQPQAHNVLSQNEAHTTIAFPNSYSGNPQVPPQFEDQMSYRTMNYQMPAEVQNVQSGSIISEGTLHKKFLEPKVDSHVNGTTCSQENNKPGVSYGLSGSSHLPYHGETNDRTGVIPLSSGSSLCAEQSQDPRSVQSELQFFNSNSFGVHVGKISEKKELYEANDSLKMKVNPEKLQGSSPCIATDVVQKGLSEGTCHPKLDDKTNSPGKPGALVSEKLWEGRLQLSSSVTVSAVAFFKSGEKLHATTDWFETVDVKGKVRLEAFEKYIQDLPRSRNRGMMVISLCCKEESQGKGNGMKEVAKGYQKNNKVGFAKLSGVVDVYICPRSDVIITILAKYGFFKGMAVVEDKPDSMVGCVVWKKNPASSNSVVKKTEIQNGSSMEQLPKSPSHPPVQKDAEKHISPMQPSQTSAASMPTTSANIDTNTIQSEAGYTFQVSNSCIAASVPIDSTSVEVRVQGTAGSITASVPEAKQPKARLEGERPLMPCQPVATASFDDDDLPEFDFASVRMVSQTTMNRPSNPVLVGKDLPAETVNSTEMLMIPGPPKAQAVAVPPQRSHYQTFPSAPFSASEVMSPLNKFGQVETQIPNFPGAQESQRVQNNVTTCAPGNPVVTPPPKGLFDDDDDDIPEWCPPELHRQQPWEEERSLSPMSMSPELPSPKPAFRSSAPGPQNPAIAPTPVVTRPPFPSQVFPPTPHYSLSNAPQPKPPSAMDVASSISVLGPPPKHDGEYPFQPESKWGELPRFDDRRSCHPEGKRSGGAKYDDRRPYQPASKRDEVSRFDDRRPYQLAGKRDQGPKYDDRRPHQPAGQQGEGHKFDDRHPYLPAGKQDEDPMFGDRRPYQPVGKWDEGPKFDDRPYQPAGKRNEGPKFDDRRPYQPADKREEGPKFDDRRPYPPAGKRDEGPRFDDRRPYQTVGKLDEGPKFDNRRPYQPAGRRGDSPKFDDRRSFRPSRWDEAPKFDGSRTYHSPGRRSRRPSP